MKKLIAIAIIGMFLLTTVGCATNRTMQGAGVGAGAGTIASVIAGKSGKTSALLIMGGALLGGLIGNTLDQQAQQASMQPENRNKSVIVVEEEPSNARTNCNKVTKKTWKNGSLISETTEEVCRGERQSNIYE
jgi:chromate transport protein ChrA